MQPSDPPQGENASPAQNNDNTVPNSQADQSSPAEANIPYDAHGVQQSGMDEQVGANRRVGGQEQSINDQVMPSQFQRDFLDMVAQLPIFNITYNMGGQYSFNDSEVSGAFGTQAAYNAQATTDELSDADVGHANGQAKRTSRSAQFNSAQDVERWFFGLIDDEDPLAFDKQIHLIIVAIFAGNSARFINAVSEDVKRKVLSMYEKIEPEEDEDTSENEDKKPKRRKKGFQGASPFQSKKRKILNGTGTKRVQVSFSENGIPTRVEALTFEDNRVQPFILEFLRTSPDLSDLRDVLQKLLFDICQNSKDDLIDIGVGQVMLTRSQAGLGLGELAKNDFVYYMNTFINPLANLVLAEQFLRTLQKLTSKGKREDETVMLPKILGWIFHRLASDPSYKDAIFIRLEKWIERNSEGHQIVAAASCLALGFVDIERTIVIIKKAMAIPNLLILSSAFDSVAVLYQVASGASRILYHFALWQRLPQDNPINKQAADNALLFFLLLVRKPILDDMQGENQSSGMMNINRMQDASMRTVWAIVKDGEKRGETTKVDILDLIKACLVHRKASMVDEVCKVLEDWLEQAGKQADLQNIIIDIFCALHGDRYGKRHIERIIKSRRFTNNPVAHIIRQRCL